MNRTSFIVAAGGAAAALGATGAAGLADDNQIQSDYAVRSARASVAGIIAELETEQTNYGGHRVKAIDLYKQAQDELNKALDVNGAVPGQRSSDYVLRQARTQTSSVVTTLNAGTSTYGGHRAKAISILQDASAQLTAALNS